MVFSSITFLYFFLVIVLVLYYNPIWHSRAFRNVLLLLASLAFYAWGEPYFVFIMVSSIIVNWLIGLWIDKSEGGRRKAFLILALLIDFSILFAFKYLVFFGSNLYLLLGKTWSLEIALPIGISFYTFQIASYMIDLYKKKVPVQRNVLYLGLYISMFPQLIAGPIVRYETIADEIENRKENWTDFSAGMVRFVYGLAKKVILANNIAMLADKMFAASELSVLSAWLGAIAYTLQIFFDFSGYSDMAIGLGSMFGFHFNENFNRPYLASSVTEFWRRWHISLSTWFRDYVYIPLGGSRVKTGRHIFNLFVVWALTGLWHGANWTFIVWGLLYFVFQVFEKYVLKGKMPKGIGHVYTLLVVICCWVIFRADSLPAAAEYIGKMFGSGANGLSDAAAITNLKGYAAFLALGILCCLPVKETIEKLFHSETSKESVFSILRPIGCVALFLLSTAYLLSTNYNPFIYFNF